MKMKKIKYEDAAYIRRYKKRHTFEKYFCNWFLVNKSQNCGQMRMYVKWWAYIILFIPIHLAKVGACIWDGGLREFSFEPRCVHYSNVVGLSNDGSNTEFGRFKEVWDKYESN